MTTTSGAGTACTGEDVPGVVAGGVEEEEGAPGIAAGGVEEGAPVVAAGGAEEAAPDMTAGSAGNGDDSIKSFCACTLRHTSTLVSPILHNHLRTEFSR